MTRELSGHYEATQRFYSVDCCAEKESDMPPRKRYKEYLREADTNVPLRTKHRQRQRAQLLANAATCQESSESESDDSVDLRIPIDGLRDEQQRPPAAIAVPTAESSDASDGGSSNASDTDSDSCSSGVRRVTSYGSSTSFDTSDDTSGDEGGGSEQIGTTRTTQTVCPSCLLDDSKGTKNMANIAWPP